MDYKITKKLLLEMQTIVTHTEINIKILVLLEIKAPIIIILQAMKT